MGECSTVGLDRSRTALAVAYAFLTLTLIPVLQASAQEMLSSCTPGIGRITAFQGAVEIQRAGQTGWAAVKKLDTALCAEDGLRTDSQSRALVSLEPETMVRVDQNTVIRLKQSDDAIEVEFFGAEIAEGLRNTQARGAGYFITRFPKKFKVTTPHMNAAVEGTEFMVQVTPDATKLTVLEGKVSSQSVATGNTQLIAAGQSIASGATGPGTIETVVKPQDAVQWVLRYPPISDQSDTGGISQAEKLLRAGSVDEALAAIDAELAADPSSSDAHALRAVIQVAKNDKVGALESAGKATEFAAENYRAWLALSYAQQAGFQLEAALESARKAEALRADSALAHSRVAELLLSLGDSKRAEQAAREAVAANAEESYAHSMLGFVHLAQVALDAARADFRSAIERDSFSALPRLGLGLVTIRDGELVPGREQLEIAVALDPSNSLLRSYVGKAYYEEATSQRSQLAESQYSLAKQLDPNDPTPALYDAVRLQTVNRPNEAVNSLQASIALNDNRAVYRSTQLLTEDSAVRATSLARAYHEIGFDDQALRESAISIAVDPGSSSAHRFLADSYLSEPRHEIARRSELLQAQLLQPLNANPVQPQLTEDNFFVLKSSGPSDAGFNEFTPMFTSNGVTIQADVVGGELDTWGDQLIISGIHDRMAYAVSQLAYSTDGFRVNDDFDKNLYSGFVQFEPGVGTSLQFEARHSESEFGDPLLAFDPELVIDDRHDLRDSRIRGGFRRVFDARSQLLISINAIDQRELVSSSGQLAVKQDTRTYVTEIQHVLERDRFNLVSGIGYDTETQRTTFFDEKSEFKPQGANAYAYLNTRSTTLPITLHLGVSVDHLEDKEGLTKTRTNLNPKIGVTASPWHGATFRAAMLDTLARQFAASETVEPTQVAGFNQFFDDLAATSARRTALALDQTLFDGLFIGAGWNRRDLTVPLDFSGEHFNWDERSADVHVYWSATDSIALSAKYSVEEFKRPVAFPGKELIRNVRSRALPVGIAFHSRSMFFARATASYVKQTGKFFSLASPEPVAGEDSFWNVDASVGYRLPGRRGTISLEGRNIFGEQFKFQETDLFTRQYARERVVLFRASLAF